MPLDDRVARVAKAHGIKLLTLTESAKFTDERLIEFRDRLSPLEGTYPGQIDVVVFGSIARGEASPASDCDYLVVIDDLDAVQHAGHFLTVMRAAVRDLTFNDPGQTGIFGTFTSSADMVGRIGLESRLEPDHYSPRPPPLGVVLRLQTGNPSTCRRRADRALLH